MKSHFESKVLHELEEQTKLLREQTHGLHAIAHTLHQLLIRLIPVPDQISIHLPGEIMATPKTYPVGTILVSLPATEFDTLVSPPAPFTYAQGSVIYTQSGGAGTFTDNGDGTFTYTNTVAEVITVTANDNISNPSLPLSDSVVITFAAAAELPNQLNIVLP